MKRHRLDHIIFGIVMAFIVVYLGSIMISGLEQMFQESGAIDETTASISGRRSRTSWLIAICLNIITINYFKRIYWLEAQRGALVGTFAAAMIWFYNFYPYLLN